MSPDFSDFTEFDEMMAIDRVMRLCRERGQHPTVASVRASATKLAKFGKMSLADAFEHLEQTMLDDNPRPEKWE